MVDRLFQTAYWCAYRMLRLYWAVRHPLTHGALVAVWCRGRILLVRNSYTHFYTAPGGYVHRGETARQAAVRELAEEVGITTTACQLEQALELTHDWDHKRDHVCLYRLDLSEPPRLRPDNREVVEAGFYTVGQALALELFPPLRQHIESVLQTSGPAEAETETGAHPRCDGA